MQLSSKKAKRVYLLKIYKNRQIRLEKGYRLGKLLVSDNSTYLTENTQNNKDSFYMFIQSQLQPARGEIQLDELYSAYDRFCEKYELSKLPKSKFFELIASYVEVDFVNGVAKGIKVQDKGIRIENESNIYLYETGLLKRKIPVYLVVEGVPKAITFDELRSYAIGADNTLISLDDELLNTIVGEAMLEGAIMGPMTFRDVKLLAIISIVFSLITLIMMFYVITNLQHINAVLSRII